MPVILAIFSVTVIMGAVCIDVRKKEKASSQYSGGDNKITKMVFKQSVYFVGGFYLSWAPYLILQVREASVIVLVFFATSN